MTDTAYPNVNRENCLNAETFEHTTLKNADKTPLRTRRNGKTQTWKRSSEKFRIPVKYGLYEYYNITQDNCHEWVITS